VISQFLGNAQWFEYLHILLLYSIIDPKFKNSNAGNSGMPKRSWNVLLLCEKVKVLDLARKEKESCAEVAKI
jgi:hypothetical protein